MNRENWVKPDVNVAAYTMVLATSLRQVEARHFTGAHTHKLGHIGQVIFIDHAEVECGKLKRSPMIRRQTTMVVINSQKADHTCSFRCMRKHTKANEKR